MEIEYSTEVKGKVHAYRFDKWEKEMIAKALKPEINRILKKIYNIENHPDNEGQVTYSEAIREHRHEIKALEDIIKEFNQ